MPIEDFGLEAMSEGDPAIFLDTSVLNFNVQYGMSKNERKIYHRAFKDRSARRNVSISLEKLEKSIDFNEVIAFILQNDPALRITGGVPKEYPAAETQEAARRSLCYIKEKLVRAYNASTDQLKDALASHIFVPKGELRECFERTKKDFGVVFSGHELSPVDEDLVALAMASADERDTVLASNDRNLLTAAHIVERMISPRYKCDLYTTLRSETFREADGSDFNTYTQKSMFT